MLLAQAQNQIFNLHLLTPTYFLILCGTKDPFPVKLQVDTGVIRPNKTNCGEQHLELSRI